MCSCGNEWFSSVVQCMGHVLCIGVCFTGRLGGSGSPLTLLAPGCFLVGSAHFSLFALILEVYQTWVYWSKLTLSFAFAGLEYFVLELVLP